MAAIRTGAHLTDPTRDLLLEQHPALSALYQHALEHDDLFDLQRQIAMARALADFCIQQSDLGGSAPGPLVVSEALQAIQALSQVAKLTRDYVMIEKNRGALTHGDLKTFICAMGDTLAAFLSEEQLVQAEAHFRANLAGSCLESSIDS